MPSTRKQQRFGCVMEKNPAARKQRGISKKVATDLCHNKVKPKRKRS